MDARTAEVAEGLHDPTACRGYDVVASLALAVVAIVTLCASGFLPWWTMQARAPQYGQRVLVIHVSPRRVTGDVFELDALGHYVGIQPLAELAPIERSMAPFGLVVAVAGLLVAPFMRRRYLRALAVLPAMLMPVVFLVDLDHWMKKSTNERDPSAALNLTIQKIDAKLLGRYDLGQFKVEAEASGGLYVAGVASFLGLGLIFATALPLPSRLRRRRAAAGTTVIVTMLALPSRASAGESVLGQDASLEHAIAAAAEGDTIVLSAGLHRERVTIDRRLNIVGEPGAVLDGGGSGTVMRIRANGVEVRGLTIRNSGDVYSTEDAGIRVEKAFDVRISDTIIEDALFGIFAAEADRCRIERTTIIGKDLPHVRRGDGIRLWYSGGCTLRANRIERSRDVIIWYSADTVVEDNDVRHSRYGLHYMYSDRNVFRKNRFEDNQVGAAIMYSHGVELRQNAFSFSNGVAAYGLLVKDADDIFIEENRFVGNATALFLDGAPQSRGGRVTVHNNLIARNDVGIALQPLSKGVEIWENSLIGNQVQVQILGTGTGDANFWAKGGRGNYWSEATVYDRNGDGVSDLPYSLESSYEALADSYPALAFFRDTPGAEAIDAAARMFPLFAPRPKLTDPAPLSRPVLTPWTIGDKAPARGLAMPVIGGGMLALAIFAVFGSWKALS